MIGLKAEGKVYAVIHFDEKIHLQNNMMLPEFDNLIDFCKYIKMPPPLDEDFDVRKIEDMKDFCAELDMKPFRHRFYAISLYLKGDGVMNTGFWKRKLDKPALFFKTPYQVMSWQISPGMLKEYFILFTEKFLLKHKQLSAVIFDFPFLQLDRAIPFEIEKKDTELLANTYTKILEEYHSDNKDRFEMISAYVYTLLLQVRRLYDKFTHGNSDVVLLTKNGNSSLVEQFKSLLEKNISSNEENRHARSVSFYAKHLSVHPNYLNAVVKRVTGKTALHFIHEQIINSAETLLLQTNLSVKEVAYQLSFNEPAHFGNFFKKYTQLTPADFREQSHR